MQALFFSLSILVLLTPFFAWSTPDDIVVDQIEESQIEIDGLVFRCKGCKKFDNNACELLIKNYPLLLPCREALVKLLFDISPENFSGETPTYAQLVTFLLEKKSGTKISKHILKLLLSSDKGAKVLKEKIPEVMEVHKRSFRRLAQKGKFVESALASLWQTEQMDNAGNDAYLRSIIVANCKNYGLIDLIKTLSATDLNRDYIKVLTFDQILGPLFTDWSVEFNYIKKHLIDCEKVLQVEQVPEHCFPEIYKGKVPEIIDYINRVQGNTVLSWIKSWGPEPINRIQALAQIDYENYSTLEIRKEFLNTLNLIHLHGNANFLPQLLSLESRTKLINIAKYDFDIARKLASLFLDVARSLFISDKIADATEWLEISFEIWPQALAERNKFLVKMLNAKSSSEEIRIRLKKLVDRQNRRNALIFLSIGGVVMVLLMGWLSMKIFRLENKDQDVFTIWEEANKSLEEKNELKELLRELQLPLDITEKELSQAFREQIKILHPDNGGDPIQFANLSKQYKRAKQLLKNISQ